VSAVQFGEDGTGQLVLADRGSGPYRADESAVFGEMNLMDKFSAEVIGDWRERDTF